jgi:hypothetical protein
MADHTQAIDQTAPANGTNASGGALEIREFKRDISERLLIEHYHDDALTGNQKDGGHINITQEGSGIVANTELIKSSGFSLTGSNAQSLIDQAGTWNTSGTPTGWKLNVTDTASATLSLLVDLLIGGASKFKVDKAGNVTVAGNMVIAGTLSAHVHSRAHPVTYVPAANNPPASNPATLDTRNAHPVLDFDAGTDESAVFPGVLAQEYGTEGLTIDIFWSAESATSGNVVWNAAIESFTPDVDDVDGDSFAAANAATSTTASGAGEIIKTSITFIR